MKTYYSALLLVMRIFSWVIAAFLLLVLVTELLPDAGFLTRSLGAGELVFVAVCIPVVLVFPAVAKRWFEFIGNVRL